MFSGLRVNSGITRAFSSAARERAPRIKHKIPQKRASSLLNILQNEEYERLKDGRQWPQILAGDSIAIKKLPHMSSPRTDEIKGMVIGITRKNSDTAIKLLNVEHGTPVYRRFVLYSPMLKDISVIQKAALHDGKKKVVRNKLYYLIDRHPDTYTVK